LESPSKARLFQKITASDRGLDRATDVIERVFGKPVGDKQLKAKSGLGFLETAPEGILSTKILRR